jgi:two-component system catabolic regulation response regulator CreB/two-component system response regulator ChvI
MSKMKKILVVDDESDVCLVLEKVLSDYGFVVDAYEHPLLALEKFKANSYDLVILDIRMPELNGFAIYREIKRLDKKVKICFLTAGEMYYGSYSDIFSSLPANHFIRKPIDNEELMKRINEIIGNTPMITAGEKRRIMIVDDDPDIANLYRSSLEHIGFLVAAFNDPLLALYNYKAGTYDLLLIDIKMPQMNGFELYQKLSNMGDKSKVCFITAFEEFNKQFKELFPDLKEKLCFLRKPIELHYLTRVVKSEMGYN